MLAVQGKELFEKLEFDKILELLQDLCLGEPGKAYFDQIPLDTEKVLIEGKLREVMDFKLSLEEGDQIPLRGYEDWKKDLRMLEIEGSVLSIEALLRVYRVLGMIRDLFRFFTPTRQEVYPRLFRIIDRLSFDESLVASIEKVIDEEGHIRPDASQELLRIRKNMLSKQRQLEKEFRQLIGRFRQKGWLSDSVESFRNGRRVLSVPAEHKRKVKGIIHDESATGKTAFIEPEAVIGINNDIIDLENEERREIYRILKELSQNLRPSLPLLRQYGSVVKRFDIIQAKAMLAHRIEGSAPFLSDRPGFHIIQGRHPLLWLKNNELGKPTIPFDLQLDSGNRILVLSGPNAGGKSVAMKAVGLLQLMLQAGIPVPVDGESEMGVFQQAFVDMGDQQSLEDDLSTYSSRLKNMKMFLEKADEHSLVLIDEFGSGTDPKTGGAIAEAILESLCRKKVFGLITTHYSNLKIFAFKKKGILNGAMAFNSESLSPTFQLETGNPGSSYAFEIAQKIGMPPGILEYAKNRAGEHTRAVDQLLIDLQREKKELEDQLADIRNREKKLERLIKNYDHLSRELEFKRKKFKLESKQKALQQAARDNKRLEKLVREIREAKNEEEAKKLAARQRDKKKKLESDVQGLQEEVYARAAKKLSKPIQEGDFVRFRDGATTGKVETINKKKAIVLVGQLKMTVPVRELVHASEPLEVKGGSNVTTALENAQSGFHSKLDIRGMRKDEAEKIVETFMDKALMANATHLRIVHGKGNGILREVVKNKLKEYSAVTHMFHPEEEQGGEGVTIAELR